MTHFMKLKPKPFNSIRNGFKTIELRLNDEKRQKVKVGDFIEFTNMENPEEKLRTEVIKLHYFNNFKELYKSLPLMKCGYTSETIQNADYSDMEKYYSEEEQSEYGVVGIEIQLDEVNIRIMKIDDYEEVYALWLSCSGMGLNNLDDSKDGINKFLQRNPETCFVAETGNRIVGVIIAGNDGRRGYIYHTAVSSDYRNKKIASGLVNKALSALKAEGINKTALVVFDKNKAGNEFWEKLGFSVRDDLIYRDFTLKDMTRIDT